MSTKEIEQIGQLLDKLDRLCQDAKEIRQKITEIAARRQVWPQAWPEGRPDSRGLPEQAQAYELDTRAASERNN